MRRYRNGKLRPSLYVEVKDHRVPWCSSKTTPVVRTTVNRAILRVLELGGPRRVASPAQGQTGFILQAETSADMPRI